MDSPALTCKLERRRQRDRGQGWSGIDYIEVVDDSDQRQLCVHFFGKIPEDLAIDDVRIEGGRRVRNIKVLKLEYHGGDRTGGGGCGTLPASNRAVDRAGDFSSYTLVAWSGPTRSGRKPTSVLRHFDPHYSCARSQVSRRQVAQAISIVSRIRPVRRR